MPPPRAFLITPLSPRAAGGEDPETFETVQRAVRTAVTAAGLELVHPGEMRAAGVIMSQVEQEIARADIVLAIVTGENANVFFELGRAASDGRGGSRAILIGRTADRLPFDVRHNRCITYGSPAELATLAAQLERSIRDTLAGRGRTGLSCALLRRAFDPLIADRTRVFGGRSDELSQLRAAIDDPTRTHVVLTAPAGFGKTALLAQFVAEGGDDVAYHFFAPAFVPESVTEDGFLRNVIEQIAGWQGVLVELPPLLPDLRALFYSLLTAPYEGPQVLVLDGVDEVTTWRLGPYVGPTLPERLHVVLSARDVGLDWQGVLGLHADRTRPLALQGLSLEAVAEVLRAAGGAAVPLADDAEFVEGLMEVARSPVDRLGGADPFYIRFLAEGAATGVVTRDNVRDQPPGLERYLDGWWHEIRDVAGDQPSRDLFGTLSVALGPMSQTELETINPSLVDSWAVDFFDQVIERVRRFVVGNASGGYALAHPRLADYLRTRIRTAPYAERVLAHCLAWKRTPTPYALRYLARHLEQGARSDDLIALGSDPAFYDAIRRLVPLEPSLGLQTARLALQVAIATDRAADTARLLLVHAGEVRAGGFGASPLVLAQEGNLDAAWVVTDLLPVELASLWHLLVAWDLRERGRVDDAQATVARLEHKRLARFTGWDCDDLLPLMVAGLGGGDQSTPRVLRALLPDDRDDRFLAARMLAEHGDGKAALLLVLTIGDEFTRAEAFSHIARACPALLAELEEAIARFDDAVARGWAFGMLAQGRGGVEGRMLLDRALAALHPVTPRAASVLAVLSRIASDLGDRERAAGLLAEAKGAAGELEEDDRAQASSLVASALVDAGELEDGVNVARSITDPETRDGALEAVAAAYASQGDVHRAVDTLELALTPQTRIAALARLATLAIGEEHVDAAGELFAIAMRRSGELSPAEWARTLPALANSRLLARDVTLATRFAQEIASRLAEDADNAVRSGARASMARALYAARQAPQAEAELVSALDAFLGVEPNRDDEIGGAVIDALVAVGEDGVVDVAARRFGLTRDECWTAGDFDRANHMDELLARMALGLADASRFELASRIVDIVRGKRMQIKAVSGVAARRARAGDSEARATYARALESYQRREGQADADQAMNARTATQTALVADRVARGDHRAALEMAYAIENMEQRVFCLAFIAEAFGRAGDGPSARDVLERAATMARDTPDGWELGEDSEPPWRWSGTARLTFDPRPVASPPLLATVARALVAIGSVDEARKVLAAAIDDALLIRSPHRRESVLENLRLRVNDVQELGEVRARIADLGEAGVAADVAQRTDTNAIAEAADETVLPARTLADGRTAVDARSGAAGDADDDSRAELAEEQTDAQQFDDAARTINEIDGPLTRALALATLAVGEARAGRRSDALRHALDADMLTRDALIDEEWLWVLQTCATARAVAQEFGDALATANRIVDEHFRAQALTDIACEMARAGLGDDAVRIAQSVIIAPHEVALRVVEVLAEVGDHAHLGELLVACGQRASTAYAACGVIAKVHPEASAAIFKVVGEGLAITDRSSPR